MTDLRAEILAEIRRILATELSRTEPVDPSHEIAGDLQLDSVGAVVLMVGLEDHFKVALSETVADSVVTVGDLVEEVDRAVREDREDRGDKEDRGGGDDGDVKAAPPSGSGEPAGGGSTR